VIFGLGGNDRISGGNGDDIILGGSGNDIATGGDGADIFVLETGRGFLRIKDFDLRADKFGIPKDGSIRLGAIELRQFGSNNTLLLLDNDLLAGVEGIKPGEFRRRNVTTVDLNSLG
jgi:Ca2+-binding RTX toxin-like protein